MITESSNWIVNPDRTDLSLIRAEARELHENREDLIRKKILLKKRNCLRSKISTKKHGFRRKDGDEKHKKGTFQTFFF